MLNTYRIVYILFCIPGIMQQYYPEFISLIGNILFSRYIQSRVLHNCIDNLLFQRQKIDFY